MSKCSWHVCQLNSQSYQGKFCSKNCKNKYYVDQRRKELKKLAVEYKGGSCEKCSYNKCIAAMDFHHKDPNEKDFGISSNGSTISWEKMKLELDKCLLLCSNCHRELHYAN